MENKKLSKKSVLIITGTVFIIISLILTAASMLLRRYTEQEPITDIGSGNNTSANASRPYQETDSQASEVPIGDASQAFAESIQEISDTVDTTSTSDHESSEPNEESNIAVTPSHGWVINEFGYTYLYGNCGYEQFNYKATALERYSNSLNSFASLIDGCRVFNMTVPVSSTFADIPREIYIGDNFYNQSQSAFVSTVGSKLNEKITNINIVSELEHRYDDGEYVFFRTDHNWTSSGAYTAYRQFCKAALLSAYPIESFVEKEAGEFLGSFYNATASEELERDPDLLYYYPAVSSIKCSLTVYDGDMVYSDYELCNNRVSTETAYNIYLGRDAARYEINTTADGGSLLIIGDSSVAPLAPYLASHYSKIDIINPERFKSSIADFLSEHSYDDVLTMCYSTNAVNGNFIPAFNIINGVVNNE